MSIISPLKLTVKANTNFSYAIVSDNDSTIFKTSKLPTGLTLSNNVIEGKIENFGNYTIQLSTLSSLGTVTDTKNLILTITEPLVLEPNFEQEFNINQLSLEDIAEIIENRVNGGLKGIINNTLSRTQLIAEIELTANRLLYQYALKGIVNLDNLYQDINCLEMECKDISQCCNIDSYEKVLMSKEPLPKLMSVPNVEKIQFIGSANRGKQFKVSTQQITNEFNDYSFSGRLKFPTVYITNDYFVVLRNPPTENIKYISVSALFENPMEVTKFGCNCSDDRTYQRPSWLIDEVITKMTNDYLRYFRMMAITQPETNEQINLNTKRNE